VARGRTDRRGGTGPQLDRLRGIHAVREALHARRRPLRLLRVAAGSPRADLADLVALAKAAGLRVEEVPPEALERDSGDRGAQGVELEAGPLPELELSQLTEPAGASRTILALDGVEDPQNLGAIIRVAEAAGVRGLVLTRRRSPPLSAAVARASAGAVEWLPVARVPNLPRALNYLKSKGFWVFGADPDEGEDLYGLPQRLLTGDRVVVLGAEGRGLRRGVDQVLDHRIRVPMAGRVASLNVATAAAVVLFEIRRRADLATQP